MDSETIPPYAAVIIKLLQGIVYQDDALAWDLLLTHTGALRDYFATIGVELSIDEVEGFAYVRQVTYSSEQEESKTLPRLVRRDRLTYHVTLLCVLLREALLQFDSSAPAADRLVLSKNQIRDMVRSFFQETSDEKRLFAKLDATIRQVVDLGFLRPLTNVDGDYYEVRRILKAKITADTLTEIKQKLEVYAQHHMDT